MRSIRWTKQAVKIPLRQPANSMMDLSLSLGTHQTFPRPPRSGIGARPEALAELHGPLSTIKRQKEEL
jgi:hypothetical protein